MKHNYTEPELDLDSSIFSDLQTPETEVSRISLPLKSGWLEKRSTGLVKRWIRRYFHLESQELKYYYSESCNKLGGVLNFNLLTAEVEVKKSSLIIRTLGGKRAFHLRGSNEKEAIDWAYAISLHINSANGRRSVMSVAEKSHHWKYSRISESEFKATACTGDILLFRGNDVVSKIQRFVTVSQYDHVAFILKYSSGKLALLEATSADGVSILPWDEFKFYRFEQLYERLIYRKLDFDRSQTALKALEMFILKVQGKKYRISAGKLLAKSLDKDPGNKRGFFCSELVAMALKAISVLPVNPPASRYWPGDFADEKNIQLVGGATLNPGQLIDFDI
jgi:hypothetical protein